jgi:hypothetical protein
VSAFTIALLGLGLYVLVCGAVLLVVWREGRKESRRPGFIDDRVLRHFVDEWSRDYYTRERQR